MASIGMQIVASRMMVFGDRGGKRWRNPRMCLANLGEVKKPLASPQLDHLMKESVTEIVKNINGAPFLAQLYYEDASNPSRVVIQKATSERWPFIAHSNPDGVILVQQLETPSEKDEITPCCTSSRVWGLLVQGRGVTYPACYILKTSQVQCCFGFSTHFCLAKVDCFGQDVDFHLNKLWLQR